MSGDSVRRPFGFWTATALVVGGVIGAGIFVLPSQLAEFGWTGVVAWIVGGLDAMGIALVLSSVAEARPEEPGLIAVIGEVLGPVSGVLVGWTAWVSYWCANAYIALTAARYASEFWPPLGDTPFHQTLTASLILILLTWLNLSGLRSSGRFQVATTLLKLLPLVAVLLILLGLAAQGGGAFSRTPHPPFHVSNLFTATALAFVAIMGFESASLATERVQNPQRNVPRATLLGVALSCLIYVAVCSGIVFTLPQDEVIASSAPIALFISTFWGDWAGLAVSAFAVISVVGCLNVWVLMQGEVPLGLVRGGFLPGWLARTNRRDIAWMPMVIATGLSVGLLLLACWRDGAAVMDFMLRLTAVSGLWIYAAACLAGLVLKVRPLLSGLGLLFSLAIIYGAGLEAVVLSVVLLLGALPLYYLAMRAPVRREAASG
jgi:APA family basic amino acid/polyamine antiporter